MSSSSFEALCALMDEKIATIKSLLVMRNRDKEESVRSLITRMSRELASCYGVLVKMEVQLQRQEKLTDELKATKLSVEMQQCDAQHDKENIPPHLHKPAQRRDTNRTGNSNEPHSSKQSQEEQRQIKEMLLNAKELDTIPADTNRSGNGKEPSKAERPHKHKEEETPIKEIALFLPGEFNKVPAYLRGRLRCEHVNVIIQAINTAVAAKYRIVRRPLRSMDQSERRLYDRFMEEELQGTRGKFFIVEDDIKEFTELKLDKRFYNIISILRHSRRLREIRQSGSIRYVIG